ncbi:MAG: acyl-CoA synthetase [Candidatus Sumerlaea sp.]|uniref:Oxidoreductase subunit n=1 Tax=Sumerlaea chitinivorans TaxID=2250252 RepID=A0A2Z4Y7E5_SUMC1|nr:Putative oxidoreductase subunit [Candidatus Sumerlaea chitinivorans]GIX43954.1 MAG: acyl-CoA synthetase [Candidatus Sumerlaea sp.]
MKETSGKPVAPQWDQSAAPAASRGQVRVRRGEYFDSVLLMRISRSLKQLEGVEDAVVAMGTPQNKALLAEQGFAGPDLDSATPNDLIIAVRGAEIPDAIIDQEIRNIVQPEPEGTRSRPRPRSLAAALCEMPDANMAVISVPGLYAAREARQALRRGLHVMLFSDNVSVADEIALKREALERGLLLMGPDCGTAIINGMPLGFANAVRRGPIGIVGAAGTGIQEVSSCIHRLGGGISQAIGTGGRDLSDEVGAATMRVGIAALSADPSTQVLVVISKTPSPVVASNVIQALADASKPAVVHFVGYDPAQAGKLPPNVRFADSLAGTAELACQLAGIAVAGPTESWPAQALARSLAERLSPDACLRGLFCGGTTGQEALAILSRAGIAVRSNLHKHGELRIVGTEVVSGHVLLDLGADEFTVGRPHPMIEPVLRNERLREEMQDPSVGILLFDCVLGYSAHPDPAGLLAEAVLEAKETAARRGREVIAIASVTGTDEDPQPAVFQKRELEQAGITVAPDNRHAAQLAAMVLKNLAARA